MKFLLASLLLLVAGAVQAAHVPGELLVKVKSNLSKDRQNSVQTLFKSFGGETDYTYRLVPGLYRLKFSNRRSNKEMRDMIARLQSDPSIEYAHPNFIRTIGNDGWPKPPPQPIGDPEIPAKVEQPSGWTADPKEYYNFSTHQNNTREVWKKFGFYGSPGTVIAVVDTGVDYTHKDLVANMWRNPGEIENNGIDDDGNGLVDDIVGWDFAYNDNKPWDDYGHGTHVAGLAAAVGGNGFGMTGQCPRCSIMSLKFFTKEGEGSDADAIRSLEYAVLKGAHVINSSWGGNEESPALFDAFKATSEANIINAVAAGNAGKDLAFERMYPAKYRLPGLYTVAALYEVNIYIPFWSNFGRFWVHTSSGGAEIMSTYPGNSAFIKMSGTSMASPNIAGCAALIKSYRPDLSNTDIGKLFDTYVLADKDSMSKVDYGGRPDMLKIFEHLSKE